jgi:hypothetical protein
LRVLVRADVWGMWGGSVALWKIAVFVWYAVVCTVLFGMCGFPKEQLAL